MKEISSSKLHSVCIYIDHYESGEWDAHLVCVGEDNLFGSHHIEIERDALPAQVKGLLDGFLKHMSREYNKQIADEDSDTLE